jgi:alpha/beta hydrolase family protein
MEMRTRQPTLQAMPGSGPMPAGFYDLGALGYQEREFLIQGVARSFTYVDEAGAKGGPGVRVDSEAPYVTRIVVRSPTDPARFSGTVLVEWNNVSGGVDAGPDWMFLHRHLISRGHAWVGVSAQKAGIDGGGLVDGFHLKLLAPDRYGPLVHPGDRWSFDIFTQVGDLVRSPEGESLLGGLTSTALIAVGESQSAAFLVTYINDIDPDAQTFDGFFVHGRPGSAASLEGSFVPSRIGLDEMTRSLAYRPVRIRDDARVPVMVLQSETDVILLGGRLAAQPDGDHVRLWEVAGAAHGDTYLLVASNYDDGSLTPLRLAELMQPTTQLIIGTSATPINSGPQQHYVGQAALEHLVRWAAGGSAPPIAPRLLLADGGAGLVFDEHGNATGGIRTPWVDVPTATLSGLGQTGEAFAILFGKTDRFDAEELARCYPGGRADYTERFAASIDTTIEAGFILPDDRAEILALADASYSLL